MNSVDLKENRRLFNREKKRVSQYQAVFATPEGRAVLLDLLEEGGLLRPFGEYTHNEGFLAYWEGRRSMAVFIASTLGTTMEQLIHIYEQRGTE